MWMLTSPAHFITITSNKNTNMSTPTSIPSTSTTTTTTAPELTPTLASTLLTTTPAPNSFGALPTGSSNIDAALHGGLPYGAVTCLTSESCSTRTLVAVHAFRRHLSRRGGGSRAWWVDTGGQFPAATFVAVGCGGGGGKVVRAFDLEGVQDVVAEVAAEEEEEEGTLLVVVDTVTLPFRRDVARCFLAAHARVVELARALRRLAARGAAVLLLAEPCARLPTFPYLADVHVSLCQEGEGEGEEEGNWVLEVLSDRVGGRDGAWARFCVRGEEILDLDIDDGQD
ncbi:hypothetical protein FN846DRAFT_251257 [Sphaerosporella brunnea]|uniref:Rad51-like C-terminal domain-containing protein n=1 Tax=Sphaerosporella brunnea TaxID=1250544 RepID=A0A5J5F6X1_9PEZI|nr:hypothetical protein FN846DRAFT_251257 [Sphaerosporella brunnea]